MKGEVKDQLSPPQWRLCFHLCPFFCLSLWLCKHYWMDCHVTWWKDRAKKNQLHFTMDRDKGADPGFCLCIHINGHNHCRVRHFSTVFINFPGRKSIIWYHSYTWRTSRAGVTQNTNPDLADLDLVSYGESLLRATVTNCVRNLQIPPMFS